MQKTNNMEGKKVMFKNKKNWKISVADIADILNAGPLSLDAIGLVGMIQESSDAPRFRMFFLNDLEQCMGAAIKTNHQELMDTMDSLTEKGILSAFHRVDRDGNLIDKIYLIHKMDRKYCFQNPEVEDNDQISLKECAALKLILLTLENHGSLLKSYSGFALSDMIEYLNAKYHMPCEEIRNLIQELLESRWLNLCKVVNSKDDEPFFFCYSLIK